MPRHYMYVLLKCTLILKSLNHNIQTGFTLFKMPISNYWRSHYHTVVDSLLDKRNNFKLVANLILSTSKSRLMIFLSCISLQLSDFCVNFPVRPEMVIEHIN